MENKPRKKDIEFRGIIKGSGDVRVLNRVSFVVNPGTIHGFIGPNGAGKSTTLNILIRLVLPNSGEAYVEGKSIADDIYFNQHLGFVQAEPKFPDFSVKEYISACSYLRDIPEEEAWEKLLISPLFQFADKKCKELSTGWKKILQIFVVSLYKPQVFILDEPFNGLDPSFRASLLESLKKTKAEGRTILISTHILHDLQELADDVTMIKEGVIVYSGPKTFNLQSTYEETFIKHEKEKNVFSL